VLVLSRRPDEAIVITVGDQQIFIVVVNQHGNQSRIGVAAGPNVVIDRLEVANRKRAEVGQKPLRIPQYNHFEKAS
jgi:carbon storage regulator CsrA